ncbi:hypothetical protein GCM10027418_23850 [Mariniluteicoccus endophyticus]
MSRFESSGQGPTMPDLYDQLVERTAAWADANPTRPELFELSSERELSGSDPDERVHVTIRDYRVSSIRIELAWAQVATLEQIETTVTEAVNTVLGGYLKAELEEARAAAGDMNDVHRELLGFSGEFHAAFGRAMDNLSERMRRA